MGVAPLVSRWMERLLARHDPPLRLGQYLALRAIDRESLGASELARRTGVSGPAVSQLIAGLVDQGLVEQSPAAGDRRRQELSLSSSGRKVLGSSSKAMRAELSGLVTDLPRPEADALSRGLPVVEALLSGAPPPRRPHPPHPPKGARPKRGPRP
jgi:DNA-binding MarR family transcriptional regulator